MKKRYTLGLILSFLLITVKGFAYDFQSEGIFYNLSNNNTVSVTRGTPNYSGNITIPKEVSYNGVMYSVTSIGDYAFRDCSGLSSITIPNSVTIIGYLVFEGCSGLTSLTIPNSVTSIGYAAFSGCSGLTSITVSSGNPQYDSRNSCNAIIEKSTNTLIAGCKNTVIPNSVTSIGACAFYGCSGLTSVSILNSVTSIGACAFYGCSGLTSVSIPNSVTSIGEYAFSGCSGLTSITIPSSVTSISEGVFFGCSSFIKLSIPNSVTTIGEFAFYGCSGLTSVLIPNSVTSIGHYAFQRCSGLTSLTIPNSVTSIGGYAFCGCSGLTSITIPNSVTSIDFAAFEGCSGLTSITIPNSVTSISTEAFFGCSGLSSITIPNSVTSIGDMAFYGCSGLKSVISEIQNPFEIKEGVFSSGTYTKATLTVPAGKKSAYQSTNYWNKFSNIVENEAENVILGDANGDNEVNVSDIVEVVNYIMNKTSTNFVMSNADLNGDGEVNVTDIVMMVNVIMSNQPNAARGRARIAENSTDGDCLTMETVIMSAGESKQVSIDLINPDRKYVAFQFDLTLPEGISIVQNDKGKLMASLVTDRINDHSLSVAELGNNTYRLLAFSMSNAEFYGTSGALVNITLQADADISSGTKEAILRSQVFTSPDGVQYKWSDKSFGIQVSDTGNTGVNEIPLSGHKDNLVRVYTLTGLLLFSVPQDDFVEKWNNLPYGVYIVNGQKMIKKDPLRP